MSVDLYTKGALTVIAMAMVWIVAKDLHVATGAKATSEVVNVRIVETRISPSQPIPVKIVDDPFVVDIRRYLSAEPLPVKLTVNPYSDRPIAVKIVNE